MITHTVKCLTVCQHSNDSELDEAEQFEDEVPAPLVCIIALCKRL
jgi:hypothetical protein